jgi:hypothetical protein
MGSPQNQRNSLSVGQLIWDCSFKTKKKYDKVIAADW